MNPTRLLLVALNAAILFGACHEDGAVSSGPEEVANGGASGGTGDGTGQTGSSDGTGTPEGGAVIAGGPEGDVHLEAGTDHGDVPGGGPVMLSEAQATAVLSSCSSGAVKVGEAVRDHTTDNLARVYAMKMIEEHTHLEDEVSELLHLGGLGQEPGALTQVLAAETAQLIAELDQPRGPELDLAYIQGQVRAHRQVLSMIDCLIVPAVQDAALGAFIAERARPQVAQHLMSAAAISAAFGHGIPGATTGLQSSQCDLACMPQEIGGLFPEPLRAAACAPASH